MRTFSCLSRRQREVANLICEGHKSEDIANILGIKRSTFEAHRHQVITKLQVRNNVELLRRAIMTGDISVPAPLGVPSEAFLP